MRDVVGRGMGRGSTLSGDVGGVVDDVGGVVDDDVPAECPRT
ncbi:MAG TPA: hypothetical protein VJ617_02000 [Arthrobacter sp.]|nr:hypothetical protein [Arthrobacter sp.]